MLRLEFRYFELIFINFIAILYLNLFLYLFIFIFLAIGWLALFDVELVYCFSFPPKFYSLSCVSYLLWGDFYVDFEFILISHDFNYVFFFSTNFRFSFFRVRILSLQNANESELDEMAAWLEKSVSCPIVFVWIIFLESLVEVDSQLNALIDWLISQTAIPAKY